MQSYPRGIEVLAEPPARYGRYGAVNAFAGEFLDRLLEVDGPGTGGEAAVAGPWEVEERASGGFAVRREGERVAQGDEPAAVLEDRQAALLVAAALPGSGVPDTFRLEPGRTPDGYRLADDGRAVGRLTWFDPDLVATVSALRRIVAAPRCLALVLEAAGHDALEQAGKILARRVEEGS